MHAIHRPPGSHHGQRKPAQGGSVLIQFALFMLLAGAILGIVDIGYSFYAKRDLQRIADLAALEAVQGIDPNADTDASCVNAGMNSIEKNWPSPLTVLSQKVTCGEWNNQKYPARPHFEKNATPINAAHVVLKGESPRFIPGNWLREREAVAIAKRNEPIAAFQIGSQLLNLNKEAPLGKLLTAIGLDADKLSVLDADGLVNAKISPSGLLKALGVDLGINGLSALTPDQITRLSNLTLLQVLDASLEVASDNTLNADVRAVIDVINDLKIDGIKLLDMRVPLLGQQRNEFDPQTPGIFTFLSLGKESSPNGAALDAQIAMGDILKTAIMLGVNGHAVSIPELNVLNLVQANLTVVEPPSIGVGPIGTMANSAQIRLNLDIDSKKLPVLGGLLDAMGLRINLPIKIEAVSADATLNALYCSDSSRDRQPSMDLGVESRIAKITIGHSEKSATDPENVLIKTPLSLNVRGPITTHALKDHDDVKHLIKDESRWTRENRLFLGDTVDALLNTVFNLLGGIFSPPILTSDWSGMSFNGSAVDAKNAQIEMLAKSYLEATKVNGFYNVDAATTLMLNGKGSAGTDDQMGKLVNSNFSFNNAIPVSCTLFICPINTWKTGSFSEAFKAYTSTPYSVLDLVGIPTLGNGYTSCSGLLTSLLAWNACVLADLNNLLKQHETQVNMTDGNALINSLKNKSTSSVTCSGALCVLLKPVLDPIKQLLNGLGEGILTPLITKALGLELGRSEVKALEINCESAQLVY